MQIQTEEVKTLVRNSEEETAKVRLEKMSIMQKWTTAVINLGKRDEALESFRCALKNQELALKSVKAEIEGTKEEIGNVQLFLYEYSFCSLGGASKMFLYEQSSFRSPFVKTLISIDF